MTIKAWKTVPLVAVVAIAGCGFQAHAAPGKSSKSGSVTTPAKQSITPPKATTKGKSATASKPGSTGANKTTSKSKTAPTHSSWGGTPSPLQSSFQVMGFWANDVSTPLTALYANPRAVSDLSPFWYSVDASGGIRSHVNTTILNEARKLHIPITPLVNDATGTQAFLTSPATRMAAARNIADLVATMHYQGVNIDFEPPHTHLRAALTAFTIDLRDFLPRQEVLTMDVVPHSGGAYNYPKLAPEVDQFVVMSYDEHSSGTPPGPVAAISWVQSIVHRLEKSVPPSQILLGVALYGYSWPAGSTHAATVPYNAVSPSMDKAAHWNSLYQETYANFSGAAGPQVAWWESLQGMNQKIRIAKSDHLAGIALWHVGYANNAVYQLLLHQAGKQP